MDLKILEQKSKLEQMISQAQESLNAASRQNPNQNLSPDTYYQRAKMTPNGMRAQFNRSSNESLTKGLMKLSHSP